MAVGAFSVTTLVLRPLAGRWSDRYGRRPLLIGGAGLFAVLTAGHLLVTDLGWLVGLRLRSVGLEPGLRTRTLFVCGALRPVRLGEQSTQRVGSHNGDAIACGGSGSATFPAMAR